MAKGLLQDQYKSSLYLTAKNLLGYEQIVHETHDPIIECLEANTGHKLIVVPRGAFKSSIGSISYPIWMLLNNPNLRIMIDSEIYSNSKNFLREIKGHLTSEKTTRIFGEFRTDCWNEGEIIIKQRTKVIKEPSIVCSGIGAQKTSQHYDIIIADDLNSPRNSLTIEGCQKVIDHYRLYTSLLDPTHGILVVIGTRYSQNDLIGFILENEIPEIKKQLGLI